EKPRGESKFLGHSKLLDMMNRIVQDEEEGLKINPLQPNPEQSCSSCLKTFCRSRFREVISFSPLGARASLRAWVPATTIFPKPAAQGCARSQELSFFRRLLLGQIIDDLPFGGSHGLNREARASAQQLHLLKPFHAAQVLKCQRPVELAHEFDVDHLP